MDGRVARRILRHPGLYVGALVVIVAAVAWDTGRRPEAQVTARLYVGAARAYQNALGPLLKRAVQCRYRPTCSEYSIEAVQRFGIWRGLSLTAKRVWSCGPRVPAGTLDPVPPAARAGG
jgi:hypothetical protein